MSRSSCTEIASLGSVSCLIACAEQLVMRGVLQEPLKSYTLTQPCTERQPGNAGSGA